MWMSLCSGCFLQQRFKSVREKHRNAPSFLIREHPAQQNHILNIYIYIYLRPIFSYGVSCFESLEWKLEKFVENV